MTKLNQTSDRVFPVATSTVYDGPATATTNHEHVGQAALGLARGAFSPFARVIAIRLSPIRRLGRLLVLHRLAVEAESRRLPRRADFFWREAIRHLESLWRDDAVWREAIAVQPVDSRSSGAALTADGFRQAVLCELFADTHWGFYQAHLGADADSGNRGFTHLDYLLQLATRISPLDGGRTGGLAIALRGFAATCLRQKRWDRAEKVASALIEQFGDSEEHQNLLATVIHHRAIDEMTNGDDEMAARQDAERMKAAAARLETLRARFGRNTLLFDLLAGIHFRRAVALANSGGLADALVAIQMAQAFNPALDGAVEARQKLIQLMNQLHEQTRALEARVAATANATLNDKGRQMVREAARGFGPVNAFIDSPEAARIVGDRRIAHGHAIWRSLRLSPTQASNEQVGAFYAALTAMLERAGGDAAKLEAAWDAAIQLRPEAATIDRAAALGWARRWIDGTVDQAADQTANDASEWPAETAAFELASSPRGRDGEPVLEWIFSADARWAKSACACAMVALCVVLILFERDYGDRSVRDAAFARLVEARAAGDYVRIMDAAETFLSSRLSVADVRESDVKAAYSEALVRWVTEDTPTDQAERRAARYRTLVLEPASGGSRQ